MFLKHCFAAACCLGAFCIWSASALVTCESEFDQDLDFFLVALQPYLPDVPNIAGCFRTFWVSPVRMILPSLSTLSWEDIRNRKEYWVSFGFCATILYIPFGTLLLVARNWRRKKVSRSDTLLYSPVHEAEAKCCKHFSAHVLRSGMIPSNVTFIYLLFLAKLSGLCLVRGTISLSLGTPYEFWLLLYLVGLNIGIAEVVALYWQDVDKPNWSFAKDMLLSHIPILSERIDSAKDLFVCCLAWHVGDHVLAIVNAAVLLIVHVNFLLHREAISDLKESYLPLLLRPTPPREMFAPALDVLALQAKSMLLKQGSPGRQFVSICQDGPQLLLSGLFILRNGFSIFIGVQMLISIGRLVLSRYIPKLFIEELKLECLRMAKSRNKRQAELMMEQIIAVDPTTSIAALKIAGCTALRLKNDGYTFQQILRIGEVAHDDVGMYTAKELLDAGWDAEPLHVAGEPAANMRRRGYAIRDVKAAGYTAAELLAEATWPAYDVAEAGYSAQDMRLAGVEPKKFKALGYTAESVKFGGFDAKVLKQFSFEVAEFHMANFPASELRKAGFSINELKEGGYTLFDLKEAGWSQGDLKKAGFSSVAMEAADRKAQGKTAAVLRQAKYPAHVLRQAGFSAKELKEAGFSVTDLRQAEFNSAELANTGFSKHEMRASQEKAPQIKDRK